MLQNFFHIVAAVSFPVLRRLDHVCLTTLLIFCQNFLVECLSSKSMHIWQHIVSVRQARSIQECCCLDGAILDIALLGAIVSGITYCCNHSATCQCGVGFCTYGGHI